MQCTKRKTFLLIRIKCKLYLSYSCHTSSIDSIHLAHSFRKLCLLCCKKNSSSVLEKRKPCPFRASVMTVRKGHLCFIKSRKSVIHALTVQREIRSTDGNSNCSHQDSDKGLLFLSFACPSFRPQKGTIRLVPLILTHPNV